MALLSRVGFKFIEWKKNQILKTLDTGIGMNDNLTTKLEARRLV